MAGSATRTGEVEKKLLITQQQLQEDFKFVAQCNVGGEFLVRRISND